MDSNNFTEVTGFDTTGALKDYSIDPGELGIGENVPEDTLEHVYIVFADGLDPDTGISLIEDLVLGGAKLDVVRKDTSGNAVVAVVTEAQRQQIQELPEVVRIKVNEAADVKKNETDVAKEASTEVTEKETSDKETSDKETSDKETSDNIETSVMESSDTEAADIEGSATDVIQNTIGYEVSEQDAIQDMTDESETAGSLSETGSIRGTGTVVGAVVVIAVLSLLAIGIFFRNKRR